MGQKFKQVPYQGRQSRGILIEIEESTDRWSEAKLQDGSRIRLKAVITEVVRLDGQYDKEGAPVYSVKSTNVVTVDAPEELYKQNQGSKENVN